MSTAQVKKPAERSMAGILGHAPYLKVNVTQTEIDNGIARNSNHCMVAEAIREKYPNLSYIAVDIQTIRATDRNKRERYIWLTPKSVQQMIVDWDRGVPPKPFKFMFRDGQVIEISYRNRKPKKAKLRRSNGGNKQTVPERVGGLPPPKSIGQRRAFGLRSLQY